MNLDLRKETPKEEVEWMRGEAFKDKKQLSIAVEGKNDALFWSFVFDRSHLKGQYLIFKSYQYPTHNSSGKQTLAHFLPYTQPDFAICIDSDYDYLLQNPIWQRSFVFQTYTYSIENHYCYVPSLKKVLCRAANIPSDIHGAINENEEVDLENIFIKKFSHIIYELTVESLWQAANNGRDEKARHMLGKNIRITSGRTVETMLTDLDNRIQNKIRHLNIPNEFRLQLARKGLTPQTAYLFARGHDVFNSVFIPILKLIQKDIKNRKLLEFEGIINIPLRKASEKAYRMGITNVQTCLSENRLFTDCLHFQKIENDLSMSFQV